MTTSERTGNRATFITTVRSGHSNGYEERDCRHPCIRISLNVVRLRHESPTGAMEEDRDRCIEFSVDQLEEFQLGRCSIEGNTKQ